MVIVDNARLRGLLYKRLKDTAKALDMHYTTFSRKLQGLSHWTIDEINRIEEVSGIKTDEFVKMKKAA
ncbi:MAG: hypothetical protein O7E52_14810 [Candidatus Poribacteria bacterium]|nr:hypothetical protein [Candidatus Poribacteria bacterium]